LKDAMTRSMFSKMGALMARGGFKVLKHKMDPRRVNGGTFLGLNGLAVKSHGGTDALGFASAVDLGYEMAESGLLARLGSDLDGFHGRLGSVVEA
jgi:glycerol-3-phosphate acyltransferase PlsX